MIIPGMASDSQVYLNGEFMQIGEAKISVLDRGFIFGDGIYEVVPVYNGKPFRIKHHLDRLDRSLAAIRIANPHDRAGWVALVEQLIERSPSPTCVVYLQVTRGVAKRDHGFPKEPVAPTVASKLWPRIRALPPRIVIALTVPPEARYTVPAELSVTPIAFADRSTNIPPDTMVVLLATPPEEIYALPPPEIRVPKACPPL